jgi:ATP-dependent helicase/nuclease subunit B
MPPPLIFISPHDPFWTEAAHAVLAAWPRPQELARLRIIVPTFFHSQELKAALAEALGSAFIAPKINTLQGWLALQLPPDNVANAIPSTGSQRLMTLYAELRQHAWLKKLFSARSNADLLPLGNLLLTLSDELTQALLPALHGDQAMGAEWHWEQALQQLPPPARKLLSDESQLVWSIWKGQLDANDATALHFDALLRLAAGATESLVWINPVAPDPIERAFLDAYALTQPMCSILLDWRAAALDPLYGAAWPELLEAQEDAPFAAAEMDLPPALSPAVSLASCATPLWSLCPARNLEHEAQQGAQTIINWLQEGKTSIALIAQDRVAARRIRALLERAQVIVADETGWKLSTTRAAAALAAWFDVVASGAETIALLDLLKSPFLFAEVEDKAGQVMAIEIALRQANVLAGWDAVHAALQGLAAARQVRHIARQATAFTGRKTMQEWSNATRVTLEALGMGTALASDMAGQQLLTMLAVLADGCGAMPQTFSFVEWRACVSLQMEATPFVPGNSDHRVVMLPLNGARLRRFDAVLMVGCDADALPSQPPETLFFANAVRRELGLATRESRQRQQLRDFTEVLCSNENIVLSWQSHKNGEPNPVSPWIERLQLVLARSNAAALAQRHTAIAQQSLVELPSQMPAPSAGQLLPGKLSASGYNRLFSCPYRYFATHMLHLSELEELSDLPEKRDYGGWLHEILHDYHQALQADASLDPATLLGAISAQKFDAELSKNAGALGYFARWQKVMPAYLEWAAARQVDGWQYLEGEQKHQRVLTWDGGQILLHGRIDRLDQNAAGERAVLDYKTSSQAALRTKIKGGEDQQLPFYGLLEGGADCATFVALELTKGKTGDAEAERYAEWQQVLEQHIKATMSAIQQDAPLPANGIESACQYCEVRGLCRKGAW